jgi:branched-chain amino acid transport system substrate-binding protein
MKSKIRKFLVFALYLTPLGANAQVGLKVGIIAPLSGGLQEYGLAAKNGIELARIQHPEDFKGIDFIYEDSQWDPKTAVTALSKLRESDKVDVVYNWGTPPSEAIAPIAERYHLPLIAMAVGSQVIRGNKYVIRSTNNISAFSHILAKYLHEQGYKNIGIIIADTPYLTGIYKGVSQELAGAAKVELIDHYNFQDQDFRSSIPKIKSKKYDALGVFLISGQISAFYRQLNDQVVSIPTFGTDFFESTNEIRLSRGGMNGAVYPHLGVSEAFKASYKIEFKSDYQLAYAGSAYDTAMIIAKKLRSDSKLTPEDIMSRLRAVSKEEGVGGVFSFTEQPGDDPHFKFPVELKRIDGEEIVTIRKE